MANRKTRAKDTARSADTGTGARVLDDRILKEFLTDLRCGSTTGYMMTKYNLDAKKMESLCREINRPEMTAVLTDTFEIPDS